MVSISAILVFPEFYFFPDFSPEKTKKFRKNSDFRIPEFPIFFREKKYDLAQPLVLVVAWRSALTLGHDPFFLIGNQKENMYE